MEQSGTYLDRRIIYAAAHPTQQTNTSFITEDAHLLSPLKRWIGGMMKLIYAIFIALAVPSLSLAELKEVVSEGVAVINPDMTGAEARMVALNDARRDAIEIAAGVSVTGSTVVTDYRVLFDMIKASSKGLIVKEVIIDEDKRAIKDKTPEGKTIVHEAYTLKLKATVKPLLEGRGYKITTLTLHKAGNAEPIKAPIFADNEEAQMRVRVNEDSHLHIFSVSHDGNVTTLLPSSYFPPVSLKSGEELVFPSDSQRGMGLRLRVNVPAGVKKALESILIIATKNDHNFIQGIKEPTIIDLWKELSEIDSTLWAEDMTGYEVRR